MDTPTTLEVEAEVRNLALIRDFIQREALERAANPEAVSDLIQAADEAAMNVIVHGYQRQGGRIEVELRRDGDWLEVEIRDRAPLFDPTQVPPPNLAQRLELWPTGGLGIHIMRRMTQRLSHQARAGGGNELTLACRCLRPGSEGSHEDHH